MCNCIFNKNISLHTSVTAELIAEQYLLDAVYMPVCPGKFDSYSELLGNFLQEDSTSKNWAKLRPREEHYINRFFTDLK